MILVDTSVLIDALRKPLPKIQQLFVTHQAALCGVIRAEVLHGARDGHHYQQLHTALAQFPQLPITEPTWDSIARHLWILRTAGVTLPFNDVIIATVAMENGVELWTRDAQFALVQASLPILKLFQEPP